MPEFSEYGARRADFGGLCVFGHRLRGLMDGHAEAAGLNPEVPLFDPGGLGLDPKGQDTLERTSLVLGEERRVLELVAHGASLPEIFNTLTQAVEGLSPGCMCSILLVDSDGRSLVQGAAPSLPAGYWALCQGIPIAPDLGCCSSAAFKNEVTIAEDIATDARWAPIRDKALGYGLRACWSAPIRDSTKDNVLGTFAMYHPTQAKPAELELRMVEAGAELAGKAIQRLRAQEDLIAQVRQGDRTG